MLDKQLVDRVRKVRSARLHKLRHEGKSLTDQEIHDIMTDNSEIAYQVRHVDEIYRAMEVAAMDVEITDDIAKEVLFQCWKQGYFGEYAIIRNINNLLLDS